MPKENKPNLILHIGTEKTGSKSIQKYLRENEIYLKSLGYYIPDIFGKFNHFLFPFAFYESFRNDTIIKDLEVSEDKDLFKSILAKEKEIYIQKHEPAKSRLTKIIK